jgi:anti-anti-sigma factor
VDGTTVVQLIEKELVGPPVLQETYGELLDVVKVETRKQVVLDLSQVCSISAEGLGRLTALKDTVHARGGKLTLGNVGQRVHQVFVVTDLAADFGL